MEIVSMAEIDKEIEGFTEQIKELLEIEPAIIILIDTALVQENQIHKVLDSISLYKYNKISSYYLQSRIYDKVVYSIRYDWEEKVCHLTINFKPGEFILISDEKYKLNITESRNLIFIQWRKQHGTDENGQSVFSLKYELLLHCHFSILVQDIKNIFKPQKQQGFIEKIFLNYSTTDYRKI